MKQSFNRSERVAHLIQETLAEIIQHKMSDTLSCVLSITEVKLSRDLSYAKVYVSAFVDESDQMNAVITHLNKAAPNLRFLLAKECKLRLVPNLKFFYDESSIRGLKMSALIDEAMKKTEH